MALNDSILTEQQQVELTRGIQEAERLRAMGGGVGFTQPQREGLTPPVTLPQAGATVPTAGTVSLAGGMPRGGPPLAGFELRETPQRSAPQAPQAPSQPGFWKRFSLAASAPYREQEARIRLYQGQAQMQAFEAQEKLRDQRALQNVPQFQKAKLPELKKHIALAIREKQKIDPAYQGSEADVQAAMLAVNRAIPGYFTPVDMDTMFRTKQGKLMALGLGVLPMDQSIELIQRQTQLQQNASMERRQQIQLQTISDVATIMGPRTKQGGFFEPQRFPNTQGQQIADAMGQQADVQLARLTGSPIHETLDPKTGQIIRREAGPIPASAKILDSQQALQRVMTGTMAALPGQQAATQQAMQKHLFELEKEQEKSRLDQQEQEQKAKQRMAQIDRQAVHDQEKMTTQYDRRTKLQSIQTADKQTLMAFGEDLKQHTQAEAIRLQGLERLKQIRLKSEVDPSSMTFEQRKTLIELEQGAINGRFDKALLAKGLGQLRGFSQQDQRAVLSGLLRSGAVSPDVLMEATKRLDGKDGALSKTLLEAIQEVQNEVSVDPITDSINRYRRMAKNPNDALLDLASYRDQLKAMNRKSPSPALEEGIQRTQVAMDEVQRMKQTSGGITEKGNALFESSSQAVKDLLLSRPGDLMHNATYKDVKDAITENTKNKIEISLGRAQGLKDQENIRSAGEIFGIIDKFRALGQELFTNSDFLRLSGVQGSGKIAQSYIKTNPKLQEYLRLREGLAGHLSRIGGERGMMTEGDIARAKSFVADPTDFFPESLTTFNNMMNSFQEFVANKVRGRYDQRALSLLQSGSSSERAVAGDVEDVLAEAKRRTGLVP